MEEETRSQLADRLEDFARVCAEQDSPFYERLSKSVAHDEDTATER